MKAIGYILNSLFFLVIIVSAIRLVLEIMRGKAGPEQEIHLGPLIEEISDLIADQTRKIIPLKELKSIMAAAIGLSVFMVYIVSRFLL